MKMNSRFLGIAMIIGVLLIFADSLTNGPVQGVTSTELTYMLFGIGGMCGIVGLIKLNALGQNTVARALGFVPLIGFAAFILGSALTLGGLIAPSDTLYNILASVGWIMMLVGMLIVGIMTIAAKEWHGWRRFVPLLAIVLAPVGLGIGALTGSQNLGGALAFGGFLLLGIVVATFEPVSAPEGIAPV
jgi:hypothetical protein